MAESADHLGDSLFRLSRMVLTDELLSTDLQRTVEIAVALINGCDAATVTLYLEGTPTTYGATDRVSLRLDLVQYEHADGPCLDAALTGSVVNVEFSPSEDRYPYVAAAAHADGVHAVRSHPVRVRGIAVGSLNLYSTTPHGFSETPEREGTLLAAQVASAFEHSALIDMAKGVADDLVVEVERRETLAQAEGVLMWAHHCDADQARQLMRNAAEVEQRDILEVAALILSSLASKGHPLLDTTATDTEAQRRDADSDDQ